MLKALFDSLRGAKVWIAGLLFIAAGLVVNLFDSKFDSYMKSFNDPSAGWFENWPLGNWIMFLGFGAFILFFVGKVGYLLLKKNDNSEHLKNV